MVRPREPQYTVVVWRKPGEQSWHVSIFNDIERYRRWFVRMRDRYNIEHAVTVHTWNMKYVERVLRALAAGAINYPIPPDAEAALRRIDVDAVMEPIRSSVRSRGYAELLIA